MVEPIDLHELIGSLEDITCARTRSKCNVRAFLENLANPMIRNVEALCPLKQESFGPELNMSGLEVPDGREVWMLFKCTKIEKVTPRQAAGSLMGKVT
jgi:hypothetical protein